PDVALGLEAGLAARAFSDPDAAGRAARRLDLLGEITGDGPGAQRARIAQAVYRSRAAQTAHEAEALLAAAFQAAPERLLPQDGPPYLLVSFLLTADRFDGVDDLLQRARLDAGARGAVLDSGFVCTLQALLSLRR